MRTTTTVAEKLAMAEQLKREAEEQRLAESKLNLPSQELRDIAELMHKKSCRSNHIDGCCGWFYDRGGWTEYSRVKYLGKAKAMLSVVDVEKAKAVITAIYQG